MAKLAASLTFALCSQEEWQLCFGQAPLHSKPALKQETIHTHVTSRGGRDALGMQGRDICAVHGIDLSALKRVWGYVLAAKWESSLSLGLWAFLLGCKQLEAEVPVPPFEVFFQRQRRIHSLRALGTFQMGAVNIPLLHNSPKSWFFFLYRCRLSWGAIASGLKFSLSATLSKSRGI